MVASLATLLAIEVQGTPSTPPSTSVAALAGQFARRRRQSKQRGNYRYVAAYFRFIENWLTIFLILCTHDLTSLKKVVRTTRV
jgi:hypothetical protein